MADDLDPAAVERAAQAWHEACEVTASDGLGSWDELDDENRGRALRFMGAALAAAGPLVTPEHDAQVAARALREAATALRGTSSKTYAEAWLITRADRIERQEGGR